MSRGSLTVIMDPMDSLGAERNFREWKELMEFGWEFCLQVYPQIYPGRDPLEVLKEAYDRQSREHLAANERMMAAIERANGR